MTERDLIKLDNYRKNIEEALAKLTADKPQMCKNVMDAIEHSLLGGGKRLRAVLMLEFCKMCGGNAEEVIGVACSVELIHAYSLIHDDLPCMDDDDFRRGKPSCHKVYGEATALLAGDALNTMAFEVISDAAIDGVISAQTAVMLVSALSKAAGVRGMIGGQALDLSSEGEHISLETLDLLQENKTGALIEAACVMGVILSGRYEMIPKAAEYARSLGRAFQIVDDILDVTGSFEELGKPIGSDEDSGKSTYVSALGVEGARLEARRLTEQALLTLRQFDDSEFLYELTHDLLDRKS